MTSQIIIFDLPRSGGTLTGRMLGNTAKIREIDNIHGPARGQQVEWLSAKSYRDGMTPEQREFFEAAIQRANGEWQTSLAETQKKNQILLINTHAFSPVSADTILKYIAMIDTHQPPAEQGENFTMIPEQLLLHPGTVPILTIRDPRLTVSSAYRVLKSFDLPLAGGRDSFLVTTSTIWSRVLYDYFCSHGIRPLVVDGDDTMTSEALVRHLVAQTGLDPSQALLSWPAVTAEEKLGIHPMQWLSQKTLYESTGPKGSRAAKNIDMEAEMKGWEGEFGDDLGIVKEMAELAKGDYEYLYDRRLRMETGPEI